MPRLVPQAKVDPPAAGELTPTAAQPPEKRDISQFQILAAHPLSDCAEIFDEDLQPPKMRRKASSVAAFGAICSDSAVGR